VATDKTCSTGPYSCKTVLVRNRAMVFQQSDIGYGVAVTSMTLTHQPGVRLPVSEIVTGPSKGSTSHLFLQRQPLFTGKISLQSAKTLCCTVCHAGITVDPVPVMVTCTQVTYIPRMGSPSDEESNPVPFSKRVGTVTESESQPLAPRRRIRLTWVCGIETHVLLHVGCCTSSRAQASR
jgi:hypothetical protein